MEQNGFPFDGEGCAEEQEESSARRLPLSKKTETICSIIATPIEDSEAAGGGASKEQRKAKSTPAMLRLDLLKKNRPRR